MALKINNSIIPEIVANAHATGMITAESSSSVALYQISRQWRELFQTATRHRSEVFPQWSEKEVTAAKIITSALLFLAMEKCKDVENLIMQAGGIKTSSGNNETPDRKTNDENTDHNRDSKKVADLKKTVLELRRENRRLDKRIKAMSSEMIRLQKQNGSKYR